MSIDQSLLNSRAEELVAHYTKQFEKESIKLFSGRAMSMLRFLEQFRDRRPVRSIPRLFDNPVDARIIDVPAGTTASPTLYMIYREARFVLTEVKLDEHGQLDVSCFADWQQENDDLERRWNALCGNLSTGSLEPLLGLNYDARAEVIKCRTQVVEAWLASAQPLATGDFGTVTMIYEHLLRFVRKEFSQIVAS